MTYAFNPALDPMAVAEQGFSTAPEIRFTAFTSCIGLVASHSDINVDDVTAIHLVLVSEDGTPFNNQAAENAVNLLGSYHQVVVVGLTDAWELNVPAAYQYLLSLLQHPIVMERNDGIYGGRIERGEFQIYDNGQYTPVPAAAIELALAPPDAALTADAIAFTPEQWADVVYAAAQWQNAIQDNVVINVQVWSVDMGPANQALGLSLNAMCIPGAVQPAQGLETLTRAQAKRSGDLAFNDARIDMLVIIDNKTPWITGTGSPGPVLHMGEYSLATTAMHEMCHGLGFLGLCNVDNGARTGIYTDVNLIQMAQAVAALTVPPVAIPGYFFPDTLVSGRLTPLAMLYAYTDVALTKGTSADDYIAFTTEPVSITAQGVATGGPPPATSTVWTEDPFQPFTTCDHLAADTSLMYPTTADRYFATPDAETLGLMRAMGWTV